MIFVWVLLALTIGFGLGRASVKRHVTNGIVALLLTAGPLVLVQPERHPIDWDACRQGIAADLAAARARVDERFAERIRSFYPAEEEVRAITPHR